MASDIPAVLAAIQGQTRRARQECRYTEEERAVLSKYKEEYRSKTNHDERDQLLREKVFVDIFNYWFAKEQVMPSPSENKKRIEVLHFVSWH